MLFLFGWFRVQLLSDIEHLLGRVEQKKKRDPYFPFPEFSMFASVFDPNYIASLLLNSWFEKLKFNMQNPTFKS